MSRILLLSNGHGEDLSGSLLAKYFVKKGDLVDALPIVGDGENYKKVNIRIIGKTKKFRTGGIGYNSFSGRIFEIIGCGGFLLTEYDPTIDYFFEPNSDLVIFYNKEDLIILDNVLPELLT